LAVAATPTKYVPQEFRPGFAVKRRYPYSIAVVGATPAGPPLAEAPPKVAGAPHPNGGGFVAKSAKVEATAYVAPGARVLDGARVTGRARICGQAIVRQSAQVGDDAVISGLARVGDRARVEGRAHVGGYAKLSGKAVLSGRAQLLEYATVDGEGIVSGDVMIRGFGEVHLSPTTEVTGTAMFAEDLEVHFSGCKTPRFDRGLFYGYLNADLLKKPKEVADNRGLYAHWKFDGAHAPFVRDLVGDADAVLLKRAPREAGPEFARDGAGSSLRPHTPGLQVGGHVLAAANLGFEALVFIPVDATVLSGSLLEADAATDEGSGTILSFKVNKDDVWLQLQSVDPRDKSSGRGLALAGKARLPVGRWFRIGFTFKDGEAAIFVDGRKIAAERTELSLTCLFAETRARNPAASPQVLLGAGFAGRIAEIKVTHTGELPGFDEAPKGAK
jgi:carbonic anhydrase/acetyltransferase-like protein (isoleucine patch superfamily)